jgi:plastocyanin domain-containing protein
MESTTQAAMATDQTAAPAKAKKSCSCCASTDATAATTEAEACAIGEDVQEARVTVKGGYSPARVRVAKGRPVRLTFDRQETSRCSEELLIPAFGIRQSLPSGKETAIEFTPTAAGTFPFTCGMDMLRGELVVADEV